MATYNFHFAFLRIDVEEIDTDMSATHMQP